MQSEGTGLDTMVHVLNDKITGLVDCTTCGACCKALMINVVEAEINPLAKHLKISTTDFKEKFIEKSSQGQLIMKSMPCNFLKENKCAVYVNRFIECREFPHLHKNNFKDRLFRTLIHYAMCPIIYYVVEELKIETGFKEVDKKKDTGYGIPDRSLNIPALSLSNI